MLLIFRIYFPDFTSGDEKTPKLSEMHPSTNIESKISSAMVEKGTPFLLISIILPFTAY